jgi:hypothetical protein
MLTPDSPRTRRVGFALRTAALALVFAAAAGRGMAADAALTVTAADKTATFTLADLQLLPHTTFSAYDAHSKTENQYSGVPVRDLLAKVDAPLGERLRGKALRLAVIVHAKDGYATLYALAEFDEAFSDRTIYLVDSEDGKPLWENSGPLRIVAPGDKRPARWARMVQSIEVVMLPEKSP